MEIRNVIEQVQRLRYLAARSTSLNEAQAAAAAADRLLQKYRLDEADLEASGAAPTEAVGKDETPLDTFARRVHKGRERLAAILAMHYGCIVLSAYRIGGARRFDIYGRPSDVVLLRWMYCWLCTEIDRLSVVERGANARYAFWHGAVSGIKATLEASGKQAAVVHAAAHGNSAAMVLASRCDQAMTYARAMAPGKIGGGTASTVTPNDAMQRGYDAGTRLHLGAALPAGGRALPAKGGSGQ
jgi:hypothetical protein